MVTLAIHAKISLKHPRNVMEPSLVYCQYNNFLMVDVGSYMGYLIAAQ